MMAHRVLTLDSYSVLDVTEQEIKEIKNEIKAELSGYTTLHTYTCNDGQDEESRYTIGVNADFNVADDANSFNLWLRTKIQDNSDKFEYARIRVHDCMHASDQNLPCQIGDVWTL